MPDLRRMNHYDWLRDSATFVSGSLRLSLFLVGVVAVVLGLSLGGLVCLQLTRVPDLGFLEHYHPVDAIEIYDNKDRLVLSIDEEANRKPVAIREIPRHVQDAVLAAEDHSFFEHHGISAVATLRAALANAQAGHVVEGGSTITQQLVKNLFFPEAERSLVRKLAEAIVAAQIESRFSKPKILEMYLNEIYFGRGAYGIAQAAAKYFGKDPGSLTLAESAYLAGIIRSPSTLSKRENHLQAIFRQHAVLDDMAFYGFISISQARFARHAAVIFKDDSMDRAHHPFSKYPYFTSYVLDAVHNRYTSAQIRRAGLKVYTTLDQSAQKLGEKILANEIKLAPRGITQEALVSLAVKDGAIRAIVGGAGDYWTSQWNCATNPHTVGSSFKPFVYLTAFVRGVLSPNTLIEDEPITIRQIDSTYSPRNFDGKFMGQISVRTALSQSRNVPAVRVAQKVGIDSVVETARLSGITGDLQPNISLALGSCALSPLEMAAAYGCFARGGIAIEPWVIRRVDDLSGRTIDVSEPAIHRVFDPQPVAWLIDVLADVVKTGTGTQAKLADRQVAGKTGTADKARDLWFIGFTPDMVTAVWGGSETNQGIADKHVTGGTVMARIWRGFNQAYYKENPTPAGTLLGQE